MVISALAAIMAVDGGQLTTRAGGGRGGLDTSFAPPPLGPSHRPLCLRGRGVTCPISLPLASYCFHLVEVGKELPTGCVAALPSLHACCLPLSLATLRPPSWAPSRCQDHPLRFPTPSPLAARPAPLLGHSCSPQRPEVRTPPTPPPSADPPNFWRCLETLLPTKLIPSSSAQAQFPRPGLSSPPSILRQRKSLPPLPAPPSTPLPKLLTFNLSAPFVSAGIYSLYDPPLQSPRTTPEAEFPRGKSRRPKTRIRTFARKAPIPEHEARDMDPPRSSDQPKNRVASSKSPYVSSQAGSPVAWQLLDEDAVSMAKAENKMIFMNIGYNACHCAFCPSFPRAPVHSDAAVHPSLMTKLTPGATPP